MIKMTIIDKIDEVYALYDSLFLLNIKTNKNLESRKSTKSNSKLEFSCLFDFYISTIQ